MRNYNFFPGMRDGNMCMYIEYNDGNEDILFFDQWDSGIDGKLEEKYNQHLKKIRKEKLNKLNDKL